jgi:hypothetical protein
MKLRNKKTGEIADLEHRGLLKSDNNNHIIVYPEGTLKYYAYNSLAELNEEWEDYEEPKEYWWISPVNTNVVHWVEDVGNKMDGYNKEIGNYFETEEEAELAVEKLKAWKRLKDKGFKFGRWQFLDDRSGIWVQGNLVPDIVDELDILFGGEE